MHSRKYILCKFFFNHVIGNEFLIKTLSCTYFFQWFLLHIPQGWWWQQCPGTWYSTDAVCGPAAVGISQCPHALHCWSSPLLFSTPIPSAFKKANYWIQAYQVFFLLSIQRRIIKTRGFLNLIFHHQDLIIILTILSDFIIFSLYLSN